VMEVWSKRGDVFDMICQNGSSGMNALLWWQENIEQNRALAVECYNRILVFLSDRYKAWKNCVNAVSNETLGKKLYKIYFIISSCPVSCYFML
jgi:hypothetical protein